MMKIILLALMLVACVFSAQAQNSCDGMYTCETQTCYYNTACNGTVCEQTNPKASGEACETANRVNGICDGEGGCHESELCPNSCYQQDNSCLQHEGNCTHGSTGCEFAPLPAGSNCYAGYGSPGTAGYEGICNDVGECTNPCADVECPDDCNFYRCEPATMECVIAGDKNDGYSCTDSAGVSGACNNTVCETGTCPDVCPYSENPCIENVCTDAAVGCEPAPASNDTMCYGTDYTVMSHCDGFGECVDPCAGVVCDSPHPCEEAFCQADSNGGHACMLRAEREPVPCVTNSQEEGHCGNSDGVCHSNSPASNSTGNSTAGPTCATYECMNGGACVQDASGVFCECVPPYHGSHCENNDDFPPHNGSNTGAPTGGQTDAPTGGQTDAPTGTTGDQTTATGGQTTATGGQTTATGAPATVNPDAGTSNPFSESSTPSDTVGVTSATGSAAGDTNNTYDDHNDDPAKEDDDRSFTYAHAWVQGSVHLTGGLSRAFNQSGCSRGLSTVFSRAMCTNAGNNECVYSDDHFFGDVYVYNTTVSADGNGYTAHFWAWFFEYGDSETVQVMTERVLTWAASQDSADDAVYEIMSSVRGFGFLNNKNQVSLGPLRVAYYTATIDGSDFSSSYSSFSTSSAVTTQASAAVAMGAVAAAGLYLL